MKVARGHGPWPVTNTESVVFGWMPQRLDGVEPSERSGMARWLLEHVSGKPRGTRIAEDMRWTESQLDQLAVLAERLNAGEPLQYVLGEAWFDGLCLRVTPSVLIPRPESEELVAALAQHVNPSAVGFRALDWCTGSGCMALALKARLPRVEVLGYDVSDEAIEVARDNADRCGLDARFSAMDLFNTGPPEKPFDMVMSNPPYIPNAERATMHARVTEHEPGLALFVPDDDVLTFYRALERWCMQGGLKAEGWLGMECHTQRAGDVASMLVSLGGWKHVEILEDLQGLPRHVVACRSLP